MSDAIQTAQVFRGLQQEIVDLLAADEQLFGPPKIAVILEDEGDIEAQIQKSLGPIGSGGGCVIVSYPQIDPAGRIPDLVSASVLIQVLEQPIVSRSRTGNQVQVGRLAEIVFGLLHGYEPTSGWSRLQRITWQSGRTDQGYLGASVTFTTSTFVIQETVTT